MLYVRCTTNHYCKLNLVYSTCVAFASALLQEGWTSLHLAVDGGEHQAAQTLMEAGASLDLLGNSDPSVRREEEDGEL